MGEFFKSLNFNYFSSSDGAPSANGAAGGGAAGALGSRLDNDFVGQVVEVAGHRLRIKCVIAEGERRGRKKSIGCVASSHQL